MLRRRLFVDVCAHVMSSCASDPNDVMAPLRAMVCVMVCVCDGVGDGVCV